MSGPLVRSSYRAGRLYQQAIAARADLTASARRQRRTACSAAASILVHGQVRVHARQAREAHPRGEEGGARAEAESRRETWRNLEQAFTLTRKQRPEVPAVSRSCSASSPQPCCTSSSSCSPARRILPIPFAVLAFVARRRCSSFSRRAQRLDVHPGRGPARRRRLDAAAAAARRLAPRPGRRRHGPARRRAPAGRPPRHRARRRGRPAPGARPDRAGEEEDRARRRRHPDLRHHRRHRRGRPPPGQAQPLPAQAAGQPVQAGGQRARQAARRARQLAGRRCRRARCRRARRCATCSARSAGGRDAAIDASSMRDAAGAPSATAPQAYRGEQLGLPARARARWPPPARDSAPSLVDCVASGLVAALVVADRPPRRRHRRRACPARGA